jgi:serine/threonine protein phosphatase PrpC
MSIKEILQKINIKAEEQEIRDFMKHSESVIGEFLKERWNMFKQEQLFALNIKGKQIQLPNGRKDREYTFPFNIDSIGLPDVEKFEFANLPDGIRYSAETGLISGTPTIAGDHKITLRCVSKRGYKAEKEILLIIVPDPKELWKNIPASTDIEYYKPDSDCQFLKIESKNEEVRKDMVAASQRGRSHAIEGKPRDDDFALYFDEETEWYVMVVADGAGSAQFSRRGSQIACQTAIEVCKEKIAAKKEDFDKLKTAEQKNEIGKILQETIGNAVFSAHKAIEKEAKEKGRLIRDYSTTLLVSLCKKFDYGWFVGAWWVGDGGIGIYRREPQYLKVLGEPDGGEFAGQTRFLTMPEIIQKELYTRMRFDVVEDFTALILMTDGITDPKFETDANLNRIEKWHALWDDLHGNNEDKAKVDFADDSEQTAEQLLKWLDFWSKGNHDDRTIAILF